MTSLEALKAVTTVVADTGDFESECSLSFTSGWARAHGLGGMVSVGIAAFTPQDATTNPSLVKAAADMPQYASVVQDAVDYAKKQGGDIETQVGATSYRRGPPLARAILGR